MSGSETSEPDWHHGPLSSVGDEIRGKPRAAAHLGLSDIPRDQSMLRAIGINQCHVNFPTPRNSQSPVERTSARVNCDGARPHLRRCDPRAHAVIHKRAKQNRTKARHGQLNPRRPTGFVQFKLLHPCIDIRLLFTLIGDEHNGWCSGKISRDAQAAPIQIICGQRWKNQLCLRHRRQQDEHQCS